MNLHLRPSLACCLVGLFLAACGPRGILGNGAGDVPTDTTIEASMSDATDTSRVDTVSDVSTDNPNDVVDAAPDVTDATDVVVDQMLPPDVSDVVDAPQDSCATTVCSGACVDVLTDSHNCGTCGHDCSALPGVTSAAQCIAGVCNLVGACANGRADCDSMPATGCETDLTASPNCGSCGTICAEPNALCQTGSGDAGTASCVSGCAPGLTRCAMRCVDLASDPLNCNGCGNQCADVPHANGMCTAGTCGLQCQTGFGDCDGMVATGCEDATSTDILNCGTCGIICPGVDNECQHRVCTGFCGLSFASSGTAVSSQIPGDCHRAQCDGAGNTSNIADDADLPATNNECLGSVCSAGVPSNPPLAMGVICSQTGGRVCDGLGSCVACNETTDCPSGVCIMHACVAPTCVDGMADGLETDRDCGGGMCLACADGLLCSLARDCLSGVCAGGICQTATCMDGVRNGDETGSDCGGSCLPCGNLNGCLVANDCSSHVCVSNICQVPSCGDMVPNGTETDTDCGGGGCPACGNLRGCNGSSDCTSQVCVGHICQAPTCTDSVRNGSESDTDCGGTCGPCTDGLHCNGSADCTSGVCTATICQIASCTDNVQNGGETGVDCGGNGCAPCPVVLVLADGTSTLAGEFHPASGWTTTALAVHSTDDLSVGIGASALAATGVLRQAVDNGLVFTTWQSGSWSAAGPIGAGITTRAAPWIAYGGNIGHAIFHGTDFHYYRATFDGATWSAIDPVGYFGPTSATIAVVAAIPTVSFINGADGNQLEETDRTAAWSIPTVIAGSTNFNIRPIVVALTGGAELMTVYVNGSGNILSATRAAGSWAAPVIITGATTADPVALTALPSGGALVAFRGDDTNLYFAQYSAGIWGSVQPLQTPNIAVSSTPALTHGVGSATAEIAFVQTDGNAYHSRLIGGTWTAPVQIGSGGFAHIAIASAP